MTGVFAKASEYVSRARTKWFAWRWIKESQSRFHNRNFSTVTEDCDDKNDTWKDQARDVENTDDPVDFDMAMQIGTLLARRNGGYDHLHDVLYAIKRIVKAWEEIRKRRYRDSSEYE